VNVFRVHGIDASEKVVVRRQLRRSQVLAFFKALPPSLIGMEACATAHYWARELTKLGHTVRLMPAKDVKGLRQAQQERCRRCRGDLRGGATSDHAFCADQITRAAGPVDAASRARSFDAPADPGDQRLASASAPSLVCYGGKRERGGSRSCWQSLRAMRMSACRLTLTRS